MRQLSFKAFLITLLVNITLQELPSTIKVCKRNDPNISLCIINSVKLLQPRLASGNLGPGFQIPPQEPLKVDDIAFGGSQVMKLKLTNLTLHGTSQFNIEKLRANMKDLKMDAILVYPRLQLTGHYYFNAKFLGTAFKTEGEILVNMVNSVNRISIKMQKFIRDGKEYLRFENIVLKIQSKKPSSVIIKGELGSKTLDDVAGALIRENPVLSSEQMIPHFEKSLSESLTKLANQIVSTATYDEVFPL